MAENTTVPAPLDTTLDTHLTEPSRTADEVVAGDHTIVLLRLHPVRADTSRPLVFHRSGSGSIRRGA